MTEIHVTDGPHLGQKAASLGSDANVGSIR
jgi:hypothetical protein